MKKSIDKLCLIGHSNLKLRDIIYYTTESGKQPAREWLHSIKDKLTRAILYKRIKQAGYGQFGNHKNLGSGVYELKINFGSGYRIYYGLYNDEIILILIGGDKSSQTKDIKKAKNYWASWKDLNYEKIK